MDWVRYMSYGLVEAEATTRFGENTLIGYRSIFSPFRLFHTTNITTDQEEYLSDYFLKFDYLLIDSEGIEFISKLNIDKKRIVELPNNLFVEQNINETKMILNNKIVQNHNSHNKILNALTRYSDRKKIQDEINFENFSLVDFDSLLDFELNMVPRNSLIPVAANIYPIKLPTVKIESNLDFLVIDCPARNLSLLPNGIAYLEVALKRQNVGFQVLDIDVIAYHLFHMHRLFDVGQNVSHRGYELPIDPWLAHNYDVWSSLSEVENNGNQYQEIKPIHDYFSFMLNLVAREIVQAKPRIIGFSIQQCSEIMSAELINLLKREGLTSPIIVGGFSCYNFDIGLKGFPLADYMCIGEAETTIGILLKEILDKGFAKDLPGVLSKFDSSDRTFSPAPMIHDLNLIEFPKYSWSDLKIYRNWDGYQLIPIIASRGCRWSRCTFCAERFYWRIRSASDFVDELEWHVRRGHYLFMFNESDLNGMPERVLEICDEIIQRGLHKKVKLTGQLRIHRKSDSNFFNKLRAAGFVALRFGVDSFSKNGMRLQQKGYTPEIVEQNLIDCSKAGIFVEVNWVIGVPGETEEDINEGIAFILKNKNYIGRLANLNPLILVNGSVYWLNPNDYEIKFHGEWDTLKQKYPRAIPAALWWSDNPFIDASVRQKWFMKVVSELYEKDFPIGDWAKQVISDVETKKDTARSASTEPKPSSEEFVLLEIEEKKSSLAKPPTPSVVNFIEEYRGYKILQVEGIFYAIHASENISNINIESAYQFKNSEITILKYLIDDAADWANTRGTYESSSAKKENYMLADSNLSLPSYSIATQLPSGMIFRSNLKYFFVVDETMTAEYYFKKSKLGKMFYRVQKLMPSFTKYQKFVYKLGSKLKHMKYEEIEISSMYSTNAVPELISSWDDQGINIVSFDGVFYSLPHGLEFDFASHDSRTKYLNKFDSAQSLSDLFQILELNQEKNIRKDSTIHFDTKPELFKEDNLPKLIATIKAYNIVEYDGFYFAIPQSIGEVDLQTTDLTEDERVFRDVSRYAVEDYALNS